MMFYHKITSIMKSDISYLTGMDSWKELIFPLFKSIGKEWTGDLTKIVSDFSFPLRFDGVYICIITPVCWNFPLDSRFLDFTRFHDFATHIEYKSIRFAPNGDVCHAYQESLFWILISAKRKSNFQCCRLQGTLIFLWIWKNFQNKRIIFSSQ